MRKIILLLVLLSGCSDETLRKENENLINIDKRYWICTSTHIWHHEAQRGTLTRFGRIGERSAYDSTECDQWSATFSSGCVSTNSWCKNKEKYK